MFHALTLYSDICQLFLKTRKKVQLMFLKKSVGYTTDIVLLLKLHLRHSP